MSIEVDGKLIETDSEGFLLRAEEWSESVCLGLAQVNGVELTECHLEIIRIMRACYQKYETTPGLPGLRKELERHTEIKCDNKFLKSLFKADDVCGVICRIAGLPKPICHAC
ncbi:MAG: TusE/DsrC/DsvC family sulfur relay protein [Gammaproteobacteria bacterium]|nr:TusE/DsrC/DsvC family sulfur relay protein [Gammaproteobacteria bacterium]